MNVHLEGWKSPTLEFCVAKLSLLFTELKQLPSGRRSRTIKGETSESREDQIS